MYDCNDVVNLIFDYFYKFDGEFGSNIWFIVS